MDRETETKGQRDRERQRGREAKRWRDRDKQINRCSNGEMDKWKKKQTQKKEIYIDRRMERNVERQRR